MHLQLARSWREQGMPFQNVLHEACTKLERADEYWSAQAGE